MRIGAQVDDDAVGFQAVAIFRAQHRAAARREHDVLALRKLGDHLRFAIAKPGLALQLEDHRNARARAGLDFVVGVEERPVETTRDRTAHGGLTRSHKADEKYVCMWVPRLQRLPLLQSCWCVAQLTGKATALSSLRRRLPAPFPRHPRRPRRVRRNAHRRRSA
ncbi:shikimate kinase 3 [Burkholderia cenocepacia PC184]|nr:shikimate kinase 3 [Burkholderia cenocepacia PC184]